MAKILIIDDEEMILSLATKILQRDTHTIVTAVSGTKAIELFKEEHDTFDIAIVDMLLGDMNGFEVLAELRKIDPNIPGIISSGNSYTDKDIPKNINNNIQFLQKPYKSFQLSELVDSILVNA